MEIISLEQHFIDYWHSESSGDDGAHDLGHFRRVWRMCLRIDEGEGGQGDRQVLLAASYFHDLVRFPKNHPDREQSSRLSADAAADLLTQRFAFFPPDKIPAVRHAIEAHSFSADIPPRTYEARVLQDADRMEALGAIGIARTFYTAGFLHGRLFHEEDPLAQHRPLDDKLYALDHFSVKLLRLPALMQTESGRRIASEKALLLEHFREQMRREVLGI